MPLSAHQEKEVSISEPCPSRWSNFPLLNLSLPDVARLVAAMVQARDSVESRSWSHPQEPMGEAWWGDVLAVETLRGYVRDAELFRDHAGAGLL